MTGSLAVHNPSSLYVIPYAWRRNHFFETRLSGSVSLFLRSLLDEIHELVKLRGYDYLRAAVALLAGLCVV